jgi:hypothetical protein
MANLSASFFMPVATTVKELRRSLFLSRPSAVAPLELHSSVAMGTAKAPGKIFQLAQAEIF